MLFTTEINESIENLSGYHSNDAIAFAKSQLQQYFSQDTEIQCQVNNACRIIINRDNNIKAYHDSSYNNIEKSMSMIATFFDINIFNNNTKI